MTARLRVGAVVDGERVSRWVARLLEEMHGAAVGALVLALVMTPPARPLGARLLRLPLARFHRHDRSRGHGVPDALEPVALAPALGGVPLAAAPDAGAGKLDLDVVLDLRSDPRGALPLFAARHGVWRLRHGDPAAGFGDPVGFWEARGEVPWVVSVLQSDGAAGPPRILYRTRTAVHPHSIHLTSNPVHWKGMEIVLRCLRDLHQSGREPRHDEAAPGTEPDPPPRVPGPLDVAFLVTKRLRDAAAERVSGLWRERRKTWFVALRPRSPQRFAAEHPEAYRPLASPPDRFWADPHVLHRDGADWLFFEDCPFDKGRGVISCAPVDEKGLVGEPRLALQRPYHLSYPFVFEWKGDVFMLPETRENRTIELYRAERFPDRWRLERRLFEGVEAVDSTIHVADDRLWLFTSIGKPTFSCNDELHVFHADEPSGPWRPHPRNPVVSDVCRARSAGALFRDQGRLIRPSQDCSVRYGYATTFNEVEVLTPEDYRERPIARIEPGWIAGNRGSHTFSRTERLEVIDGQQLETRPRWLRRFRSGLGEGAPLEPTAQEAPGGDGEARSKRSTST